MYWKRRLQYILHLDKLDDVTKAESVYKYLTKIVLNHLLLFLSLLIAGPDDVDESLHQLMLRNGLHC